MSIDPIPTATPAGGTDGTAPSPDAPAQRHRLRRWLRRPAVVLFFLAPLVGEFLLGNLPILFIVALPILAMMYGGGALLVREAVRRRGRGWPAIFTLALVYALIEEGLVTQSLFNPNYADDRLLDPGYVPWLGTGLPWALFVLGLHVVGSISAPIAVVESMTWTRRSTPWLGRRGLIVTGLLFVGGCVLDWAINQSTWPYHPSWQKMLGVVLLVVVLVVLALFGPRPWQPRAAHHHSGSAAPAPAPAVVGATVLVGEVVLLGVVKAMDALTVAGAVAVQVVVPVVAATLLVLWSRRPAWSQRHVLYAALGVLVAYALRAWGTGAYGSPAEIAVTVVGNLLLDAGLVWLVRESVRRVDGPVSAPPAVP